MFELSDWLVAGIIDGYRTGSFAFARITEITAAYLSKGLISAAQAQEIAEASCTGGSGSGYASAASGLRHA